MYVYILYREGRISDSCMLRTLNEHTRQANMKLKHAHEHFCLVGSKRFSHIPFSLSCCCCCCRRRARIYHNCLGWQQVQFCLQANKVAVSHTSKREASGKKTVATAISESNLIKLHSATCSRSECVSRGVGWMLPLLHFYYCCCCLLPLLSQRVWAIRFLFPSDEAEKSNNRIE